MVYKHSFKLNPLHIGLGDILAPAVIELGRGDRGVVGHDLRPFQSPAFFKEGGNSGGAKGVVGDFLPAAFTVEDVGGEAPPLHHFPGANPIALTVPEISSVVVGFVVPMPTLPLERNVTRLPELPSGRYS